MAISWGAWQVYGGLNNFRVGLDLVGQTLIAYGQAAVAHSWNATLARSGPWSGSSTVSFSSSNGTTTTKELYRQTVSANGTYGVSLTVPWTGQTASVSRSVSFTAAPSGKPATPTFARTGGRSCVLSLGAVSGATSHDVQIVYPGGDAKTIASPSSTTQNVVNIATNSSARFRSRGKNAGGVGPWSDWSAYFYTTPGTPSTPVLSVDGGLVTGTVSGSSYYKTGLEVERSTGGSFLVGTGTGGLVESFTDSTAGVGIKYRVRRFAGANDPNLRVFSAWSGWSVAVTSIAPPLAPSIQAPLGSVTNASPVVFRFVHQPVDGTALSAAQIQYRTAGSSDAWVVLSAVADELTAGSNGAWSWLLSEAQMSALVAVGPQVEYQVQTRGQHPDYGPWSPTQVVRLVSPPACSITSPEPGAYAKGALTVAWGFGQAEGLPQSGWRAVLYVDGVAVEAKQASNSAKSTVFGVRLENGASIRVEVAVAASGVWSEPAEIGLQVAFIPPGTPYAQGQWDETTGVTQLLVATGSVPLRVEMRDGQPWILEA